MDVTSYLLGKKSGGGKAPLLQDKEITITKNGTTNVTADEGYDGLSEVEVTANISGGDDLSEYFNNTIDGKYWTYSGIATMIKKIPNNITINGTSCGYMFYLAAGITTIPLLDTSEVLDMQRMFGVCNKLTEVPLLDTSNVENMNYMFEECTQLTTVPQFNSSKLRNMNGMFSSCLKLTDTSLNNILAMCSNATSYTGTKTLATLGITNQKTYPVSRIEALSNYQDFIDAGWTIGYN